MVVSDGLRSTLIWSKLKNFPREACLQALLEHCVLYIRKEKILHAACGMAALTPLYVCPPFFNLWIHPCWEHENVVKKRGGCYICNSHH